MSQYQKLQGLNIREDLYDALVSRTVRKVKQNDVVNIACNGSTNVAANGVLCSGTTDANYEMFLTSVYAASDTAGDIAAVVVNGSTIMPFRTNSNVQEPFVQNHESYFARIPASATIELVAENAGTWVGWMTLNREPTHAKIEAQMYQ